MNIYEFLGVIARIYGLRSCGRIQQIAINGCPMVLESDLFVAVKVGVGWTGWT